MEVLVSSFCLVFGRWWLLLLVLFFFFFSVFHSKTSCIWVPLSLDLQNFLLWFYLIFSMLLVCSSPVIHTFCLLMEFCASHVFWSNSKCVSLLFECSNHLSCLQTLIFFFSLVHSAAKASSEVFFPLAYGTFHLISISTWYFLYFNLFTEFLFLVL